MRASFSLLLSAFIFMTGCHSPYAPDCSGEGCAAQTIQALIPNGLLVRSEARKDFELGAQRVSLSIVKYGQPRDCEAGCISSVLCAIEDAAGSQLYYAVWNVAAERSPQIALDCPALASVTNQWGETWPSCRPPGLEHAVTVLPAFQALKQGSCGNDSAFHSCFTRCCRP